MKIILDTNILLIPVKNNIDIFTEITRLIPEQHEIMTLSLVVDELKELEGPGKDGIAAKVGSKLLTAKNVKIIQATGITDEEIIKHAEKEKTIVATNDRELRKKLKEKHIQTLFMRDKSHLDVN